MAMEIRTSLTVFNLKKQQQPVSLFVGLSLSSCSTLTAITNPTNRSEHAHTDFNANNSYPGTDINADVRGLCKQGRLRDALSIFHAMDQQGIRPHSSTYASLLQECVNKKALPEGKLIHAHMIQRGFNPNMFLGTKLVIMYARCGSLQDSCRLLEEMPQRNVVSWTAMIVGYANHGRSEEALTVYYRMQKEGIRPDKFAFAAVLPACSSLAALRRGQRVHRDIIGSGLQYDIFVGSALIDMYVNCGRIKDALQVFDKMPERNVVSWTAIIGGYAQNGRVDKVLELFQKMPERDLVSSNAAIAGYVWNGLVDEALRVFWRMPERNAVSWTAMASGYAQTGLVDEALKLFQKMPEQNGVSLTAMIAGYAQAGLIDEALELVHKMPEQNAISWTAIVSGYGQSGRVDEAMKLFQKMSDRGVVTWNAMIAGCVQSGYFNEALKVFRQIQLTGLKPDSVTFSSILSSCANLAALKHGKEVHGNIIRSRFQSHIIVGSALVDMYAKCGNIQDACKVFDKMVKRDIILWNAMIVGYAKHGCGKEALRLFEQMQVSGTKPDHVTFIGVLSACSHTGLVDVGCQYFDLMSRDYHITPAVEHYSCMIDLLGRAGCLDEAQQVINQMPIKPSGAVWGSLLSACRSHNNIELGERVAQQLLELDPKNAACYVLLSNIYAVAGRWDDAEKVRKMMKERRVTKIPGCSWIEINNKAYSFLVKDRSHLQTCEIYVESDYFSRRKGMCPRQT